MESYNNIAKYYSLITRDKDWEFEALALQNYFKKFGPGVSNALLDVGCGAGHHLKHLTPLWNRIDGIDASKDMLTLALNIISPKVVLYHTTLKRHNNTTPYDMVMANYAVINHCMTFKELDSFFNSAASMLNVEGLFVFDYISRTATALDPPRMTEQRYNDSLEILNTNTYDPITGNLELVKDINWQGGPFVQVKFNMVLWLRKIFDELAAVYNLDLVGHFKQFTTETADETTYKVTAIYKARK